MINQNIGYIILEGDINEDDIRPIKLTKTNNNKIVAEAVLQTAEVRNRNGRVYPRSELIPQLTANRTVELLRARALKGELGHPLSESLQRQSTIDDSRTCVVYTKLWNEGDDVLCEFTTTNNEWGIALDKDIREGYIPAFSLRALGSLKQTARGAEVVNLKLITYDQVIYPSHQNAYMTKILSEASLPDVNDDVVDETNSNIINESRIIPFTDASVISYLQSQSKNLKFFKECFDFAYNDIKLDNKYNKVMLTTKQGEVLVVNLENYISRELMDYAASKYNTI